MDNNNFFDDFFENQGQKDNDLIKNSFEKVPGNSEEVKDKVMLDTAFFLSNALFSLLVQKGILNEEEVSEVIDDYISNSENESGEK